MVQLKITFNVKKISLLINFFYTFQISVMPSCKKPSSKVGALTKPRCVQRKAKEPKKVGRENLPPKVMDILEESRTKNAMGVLKRTNRIHLLPFAGAINGLLELPQKLVQLPIHIVAWSIYHASFSCRHLCFEPNPHKLSDISPSTTTSPSLGFSRRRYNYATCTCCNVYEYV